MVTAAALVAAVARVRPLTQELRRAVGAAKNKTKQKKQTSNFKKMGFFYGDETGLYSIHT